MQKPLFTLNAANFFTGIAPSAHSEKGGLFFKADGITPLFEAGMSQSTLNGLLMAGPSGTLLGGNALNGTIIAGTSVGSTAIFCTDSGHIFSLLLDNTFGSGLSDKHTVSGLRSIEYFKPHGGVGYYYYWNGAQIGTYDGASTFVDNVFTSLNADNVGATHRYFNSVLYGNGFGVLGVLSDGGSSTVVNNGQALLVGDAQQITDISDDGTYVIIASTDNFLCDTTILANTQILFWDGFSSQWQRQYPINDPFIYAVEKTPFGVFAFGVTGIWQVSFNGVKKVFSRSPGIYSTTATNHVKYGRRAVSYYINALLWGGVSGANEVIKAFGQLDLNAPNATIYPFLTTSGKNITYVDGQLLKGYIFVGDDTPQLTAYPFSTANTPQTGVSAQTVYFPLPYQTQISRIEVTFGVPLAAGDAFNIQTKTDEATAAVTFDSTSFAADGAIRRKIFTPTLNPTPRPNAQLSLVLNWTGGAVKIKSIEVFGEPERGKTE